MAMQFHAYHSFTHQGSKWVVAEFSNRINGTNDFVSVLHDVAQKQNYGLQPHIDKTSGTITDVTLVTTPEKPIDLLSLAPELREEFAKTLAWSAKRAGVQVAPELLQAVREGRDLRAEKQSQTAFNRLTRNVDHDLESAYMLRDALKQDIRTAVEEDRLDDARTTAERLNAVQSDIQSYWNPHKPRPVAMRPLTPAEEAQVKAFAEQVEQGVESESASLARDHFQAQAEQAQAAGDEKSATAAGQKAQDYAQQEKGFAAREQQRRQERGGESRQR